MPKTSRIRVRLDFVIVVAGDSIFAHGDINSLIVDGFRSVPGAQSIEGGARLSLDNLTFFEQMRAGRAKTKPTKPKRRRKPTGVSP